MNEWQPIETAPRDGTPILGWDPTCDSIIEIFWMGGWRHTWDHSENNDFEYWMPLPKRPKLPEPDPSALKSDLREPKP